MKKTFLAGLALALGALLTGACSSSSVADDDDNIIWDFAPIVYQIQVEDAAGQDLLDPQNGGNLLGRASVSYQRETYRPMKEEDYYRSRTRYYAASFHGLLLRQQYDRETQQPGRYFLEFGEFDGAEDGENEVTLLLTQLQPDARSGAGSATEEDSEWAGQLLGLKFTNRVAWKSAKEPVVDRHFYLDGAEHDGPVFRFVYDAERQRLTLKD